MTTPPATLDHAGIAARVPHAGTMCLLESMLRWDADQIVCQADGLDAPGHPLREAGGLPATSAIEYAAQAMALHASLNAPAGEPPSPGFLASARGVRLAVARLDGVPQPVQVTAERLAGDRRQAQYRFALHDAEGRLLAEGRATVVLDTPLTPPAPFTPHTPITEPPR